jgi:anti-sigma-K factor RskA
MSLNHLNDPVRQCDAIQELIPDYVFGLTDPEETRLVESNLAYCPDAVAQLAEFQHLQAEMRLAVPQVEPPPQLGNKLMAALDAPIALPKSNRRITSFPLAWLAAAAAIIALILTNVYWFLRVNDLTQLQNQLTTLLGQSGQTTFVLNRTDDLRWVRLPASQKDADTAAFMMWNAESETGLLYAHAFPKLTAGKTYQLWLTHGNERISAGTFRVDQDGKGAMIFHITQPIDNYTWARITAEPESGSNSPSDTAVVLGELSDAS